MVSVMLTCGMQVANAICGHHGNAANAVQDLLTAFVDYIVERKTVVLEELAADFRLRVQVQLLEGSR